VQGWRAGDDRAEARDGATAQDRDRKLIKLDRRSGCTSWCSVGGSCGKRGFRPAFSVCIAWVAQAGSCTISPKPARRRASFSNRRTWPTVSSANACWASSRASARVTLRIAHLTRDTLVALALKLSTPIPSSKTAAPGSADISPQRLTDRPARRPLSTIWAMVFNMAGCRLSYSPATRALSRSTASRYWVRSLVPTDRKSTRRAS